MEQRYEDLSCPENLLSPARAISDMCAAKRESSRDRRTTWAVHCRLTGGRRQKPRRGKEKVIAAIAVGKRSNKSVLGSLFGVSQQFTDRVHRNRAQDSGNGPMPPVRQAIRASSRRSSPWVGKSFSLGSPFLNGRNRFTVVAWGLLRLTSVKPGFGCHDITAASRAKSPVAHSVFANRPRNCAPSQP